MAAAPAVSGGGEQGVGLDVGGYDPGHYPRRARLVNGHDDDVAGVGRNGVQSGPYGRGSALSVLAVYHPENGFALDVGGHFLGPVSENDYDLGRAGLEQGVNLALDQGLAAPGEQRLGSAHARTEAGGGQDC